MRFLAAVSGAVVVAGVFVAFTLVARAVVFTVDTTANGVSMPPGAVSLAGAVSDANGLEGVDPIEFAPGTNRGDAEVQRSTMFDAVHFKWTLQVDTCSAHFILELKQSGHGSDPEGSLHPKRAAVLTLHSKAADDRSSPKACGFIAWTVRVIGTCGDGFTPRAAGTTKLSRYAASLYHFCPLACCQR